MARASQSNPGRSGSDRVSTDPVTAGAGAGRPASRRTKLPEFDPSELEDLIFTPAVGSGVGSHLLTPHEAIKDDTTTVDMSTVGVDESTTVDTTDINGRETKFIERVTDIATVVETDSSTVVESDMATLVESTTEDITTPVVDSFMSPVVEMAAVVEKPTAVSPPTVVEAPPVSLWLTESGELVPVSRVKRIRLAQDVLSPAEESVYDTLWGVRSSGVTPVSREERESHRIVQAGYDFLMKRTRLSKKTIQRIVDRLIDKGFIAIEKPADIYQRSSTVYRVFAYRAVLDRQAQRGRFHVAKIGPGFVYVREVADPRLAVGSNLSTVGGSAMATVDHTHPATEAPSRGPTGAGENPTTVVAAATKKIEQRLEQGSAGTTSSSASGGRSDGASESSGQGSEAAEVRELRLLLERYLGFIDDDAARQLLRQCRCRAADCTLEEIAYFVSHKLRSVNGIHNPVGFMLTAVPRHFENNGHGAVRAFLREEQERRRRIWQEEYRYWRAVAEDAGAAPEERAQAREVIESLEKSADWP